ncbi:MAG TPA: ABC transporter permease [Conexibacter sp.]|nr:ABC transporter permease [Conexibacter sp.]
MSATSPLAETHRRYGPSAFGDDMRRFWSLTVTLATTEFKLRYFGSVLGYFWSLVRPLLFFGVLYAFFTVVLNLGKGIPHYPVYLLSSIVMWTYFTETTGGCVQCLLTREGLLRKMRFPRLVVPLSVALTAAFNLAANFVAVLAFALASGVAPSWSWLQLIPLVLLLATLAVGVGMLLSALYVRFRDVQPIWEVVVQALFYGSPIIYVAAQYATRGGERLQHLALTLNPIATLLTQSGHAFIGGAKLPSAADAAGGAARLLIPLAIVAGTFALGLWVFHREAPRIAERL